MDLNYPDFLNEKTSLPHSSGQNEKAQKKDNVSESGKNSAFCDSAGFREAQLLPFQATDFDQPMHSRLVFLDQRQDRISPLQSTLSHPQHIYSSNSSLQNSNHFNAPQFALMQSPPLDSFNLPRELQGGIGSISSRRPSYAAESFTRNGAAHSPGSAANQPSTSVNKNSLASLAATNNYNRNQQQNYGLEDSLAHLSVGPSSNFSGFQQRRPSQLIDFQQQMPHQQHNTTYFGSQYGDASPQMAPFLGYTGPSTTSTSMSFDTTLPLAKVQADYVHPIKLDNKLMLKNQHILSSSELKYLYASVSRYYHDQSISTEIVTKLRNLLKSEAILNLIAFVKKINNLDVHHRILCLVINKNGKLDLLSYPTNSNIFLQTEDMVIVDGDRGKDLAMVLEPLVSLDFAILFNFLKKIEHLRSLTITDVHGGSSVKNSHWSGIHSTAVDALAIVHSHSTDDNEFLVSLPTKQVLRFAIPREIHKLSTKFLEEKKAFTICFNKIKELGLSDDLSLINVEFQFDFKKLIFYYFAKFKRIDFRDLIKELFKIFKTRIWLCAVLPYDKPKLYTKTKNDFMDNSIASGKVPKEYDMSTEQSLSFSVENFSTVSSPSYFHSRNMLNLVDDLAKDVAGHFYGFNKFTTTKPSQKSEGRSSSYMNQPSFNPFGAIDKKTLVHENPSSPAQESLMN